MCSNFKVVICNISKFVLTFINCYHYFLSNWSVNSMVLQCTLYFNNYTLHQVNKTIYYSM